MSRRTLADWVRDGYLRDCLSTKGQWNSDRVWEVAVARNEATQEAQDEINDISYALEEKRKWDAKIRELDYMERSGELISRKEVEDSETARIMVLKQALLNLPAQMANRLAAAQTAAECQEILKVWAEEKIDAFAGVEEAE
jgi:predicted site-specific integrase-resolvase